MHGKVIQLHIYIQPFVFRFLSQGGYYRILMDFPVPHSSAQCFEFKTQSLSFSSGPSNLLPLLYFLFFIHSTCYHLPCYIIYFFMMMIIYLQINTTEQKSLSLVLTGVCQPPEPCHIVGGVNTNLLNKWKHSNYSSTSSFVPRTQISFLSYDKGAEQLWMFALEGSAAGENWNHPT